MEKPFLFTHLLATGILSVSLTISLKEMKYSLLENGKIGKLKKVGLKTRSIRKNISKSKIRERENLNLVEIHTFVDCEKSFKEVNGKKKNGK
jgi:hypothetical protein